MKSPVNIKNVVDAARLNWLTINILVKIKLAKMVFIVSANVAEILRAKNLNCGPLILESYKGGYIYGK